MIAAFLLAGLLLGIATLARAFPASDEKGALLALCCILASPYALSYDLVAVMPLAVPYFTQIERRTIPAVLTVTFVMQLLGVLGLAVAALCGKKSEVTQQ